MAEQGSLSDAQLADALVEPVVFQAGDAQAVEMPPPADEP